jgi:hypothetical protein
MKQQYRIAFIQHRAKAYHQRCQLSMITCFSLDVLSSVESRWSKGDLLKFETFPFDSNI